MFRAAKLNKVLIVGPKSEMGKTVEILHALRLLHVDEFVDGTGGMKIGSPLEGCEQLSHELMRVRRTMSVLDVSASGLAQHKMSFDDVKEYLDTDSIKVEEAALALTKRRDKYESRLQELQDVSYALQPLDEFPSDTRFDIKSLEAIAGYCKKDLTATLKKISQPINVEVVKRKKRFMLLVYYPKPVGKKVRDILELAKFEFIEIPEFSGTVKTKTRQLEEETKKINKEMEGVEEELDKLMKDNVHKLLAAEEFLTDEVEKAELPMRCATTEHLFTIEGWVRKTDSERLSKSIEKPLEGKVTVQVLDDAEVDEESPVLLKHTPPVRPFQYLVNIYSTPNLKEIDPTLIVALIFPIFFGLMIGDLGYGIILVIMGFILKKRPVFGIGGRAVGNIIMIGGIAAIIFGVFLFGDAFGVPFHPHEVGSGELTWASIGIDIPYNAPIGKLDAGSVITLLVLSISAGFLHMGLGLVFGLVNSIGHREVKHAGSRVGWMLLLLGIFILAMNLAQNTELGHWISQNLLFNLQADALLIYGLEIPWATIYLAGPGLLILVITEGGFAIIESLGMLTNLISYTRLAAVGVAKAALALAINVICIDIIMTMLGGIIGIIIGLICIAVGQFFIVVLLGTLSAGIQAIRLNYVEFFMKFYEGNGTPFRPFGATNMYLNRTGVSAT